MMDHETVSSEGYECIEPDVGREICLLDDPDLPESARDELLAHLEACDACRLKRALLREVGEGISSGHFQLPEPRRIRRRPGRMPAGLVTGGGLSLAACLVLLLVIPPRARDADTLFRSGQEQIFTRPVEGEIVSGRAQLAWQPVDEASRYRVVVDEVGGDGHWEASTEGTSATIPAHGSLPVDQDFRARLEIVPPDVAPQGGFDVSFRSGTWWELLGHRWRRGPPALHLLAALGTILVGLGAADAVMRR